MVSYPKSLLCVLIISIKSIWWQNTVEKNWKLYMMSWSNTKRFTNARDSRHARTWLHRLFESDVGGVLWERLPPVELHLELVSVLGMYQLHDALMHDVRLHATASECSANATKTHWTREASIHKIVKTHAGILCDLWPWPLTFWYKINGFQ